MTYDGLIEDMDFSFSLNRKQRCVSMVMQVAEAHV